MGADQQTSPPNSVPGGVSAAQAEAFLVARFGPAIQDVTRIGHGEWSTAYAFRRDGADHVARFGAYIEDFAKDRLAAQYASRDLPIPVVNEIGNAYGGHYAVSERAFGDYIDDLDGERMRATLPSLFAALDAARQVDLSATTGYGGWDAGGAAPNASWRATILDVAADRPGDRTNGWRQRLAASAVGAGPFDEALDHLQALIQYCPDERHLIHSDLLHFNVLVADDRISAVFDWGCSLYGDFLYDLAWVAFWAPWFPAWRGIDFSHEAARHFAAIGLDVPNFEERLRYCQVHIGLDAQKYNAFKGNWDELAATAERTRKIAKGDR
ncbi:MAG: phosphotransferase family protein [Thermomicrobiales bacterium]